MRIATNQGVAILAATGLALSEVLGGHEAVTPEQHIEVSGPVQESVLTSGGNYTANAAAVVFTSQRF